MVVSYYLQQQQEDDIEEEERNKTLHQTKLSSIHFLVRLHLPHCLQCLHCILMKEAPKLSMCRHTNEGIPSTEHVQMLHWACADIIMRGNPLTDMTDNTEDANTN